MVDIRFITILPPQQVQGVQPYQPTSNNNAPTLLATLPSGSILSGYIVNRDPSGNPVLRTDKADIVFASNFFLKIGSEVVIRVENRAGQTNARILSVNGQPPEVAEIQSAFAGEPEVIVGNPSSNTPQRATVSQAPDTIVSRSPVNVTVTATLLTPPPNTTAQTAPLPAGSELSLKIIAFTPPAQSPAPAPASTTTAEQTPAVNPSYANYARPINAQQPATVNNTLASPTVTADIPESFQPLPGVIPKPQIGQTIAATVISSDPKGEALLHTPVGVVRLAPGTALPTGSKVIFEVANIVTPSTPVSEIPARTPLPELAREWESLKEIFSLLSNRSLTGDALGLPVFPGLLTPNPQTPNGTPTPQGMSAALMVFMTALKGGDFRNWLGKENIRWLEKNGHEALIKHAEADFATLARPFIDAPPGQWQSLFFPFVVAGELQQVRLFTKRDKKKETGQNKKGDDTRFVLEVDLSQLGEMQMDGFVRKREREIHFDLIIRSHKELSEEIQRDILGIYNSTGELTGFSGTVMFQAVPEFPVNPLEELKPEHLRSLIV